MKKYRFDFLTVEVSEESLAYRVVCFIGEFEVDGTKKIQIDTIPKNVNFDKVISAKVEKVANNLCKVINKIQFYLYFQKIIFLEIIRRKFFSSIKACNF